MNTSELTSAVEEHNIPDAEVSASMSIQLIGQKTARRTSKSSYRRRIRMNSRTGAAVIPAEKAATVIQAGWRGWYNTSSDIHT